MPTVLYVLGASYSGSSILNVLLGAHPRVCAMGELSRLTTHDQVAGCTACREQVLQCKTYRRLQEPGDDRNFYEKLWDWHGRPSVIVNTSKWWNGCVLHTPLPPDEWDIKFVVLSKPVHAFADSFVAHQVGGYAEGYDTWVGFYNFVLNQLDRVQQPITRSWPRQKPVLPADILMLPYREIFAGTRLDDIFRLVGLEPQPAREMPWWEGRNCVLGGNTAVWAQLTGSEIHFQLDDKYNGKQRQLFIDDAWKKTGWAVANAIDNLYPLFRWHLTRLYAELGHPPYDEALAELQQLV